MMGYHIIIIFMSGLIITEVKKYHDKSWRIPDTCGSTVVMGFSISLLKVSGFKAHCAMMGYPTHYLHVRSDYYCSRGGWVY